MAEKIQPTALPGRWATMIAPTAMNAAKASSRLLLCPNLPLATDVATLAAVADDKERHHEPRHPGPAPAHGAASPPLEPRRTVLRQAGQSGHSAHRAAV